MSITQLNIDDTSSIEQQQQLNAAYRGTSYRKRRLLHRQYPIRNYSSSLAFILWLLCCMRVSSWVVPIRIRRQHSVLITTTTKLWGQPDSSNDNQRRRPRPPPVMNAYDEFIDHSYSYGRRSSSSSARTMEKDEQGSTNNNQIRPASASTPSSKVQSQRKPRPGGSTTGGDGMEHSDAPISPPIDTIFRFTKKVEKEEKEEVVYTKSVLAPDDDNGKYKKAPIIDAFAFLEEGDEDEDSPPVTSVHRKTISLPLDPEIETTADHATPWTPPSPSSPIPSSGAKPFFETKGLQTLEDELRQLRVDIIAQNNGVEFNMNSTQQVAKVLFGEAGGSTRRDVLEGMAGGGNQMAKLIIEYRDLKRRIGRVEQRQEVEEKGLAVRSASSVQRVVGPDKAVAREEDPLILLDASAYIFRAYYSMPPLHRNDGLPTGAVMGFCKMLNAMLLDRLLQGERPLVVLCFDAKGSKTFRHEIYDAYKGNRPALPVDLVPQFDLVRQAADAYGIVGVEANRFEADDVIATLATMAGAEGIDTNILSGDKDLMQLVSSLNAKPSVQMIDPLKKARTTYNEVVEKWNVAPEQLGDVLALAGDSADNIPGVKGIGPKTAAKLIKEYGTLDSVLENVNSIKQKSIRERLQTYRQDAILSRELVELNRTVPLEILDGLPNGLRTIEDLRMEEFDQDRVLKFYDDLGFKELQRTLLARAKGGTSKRSSSRRYEKVEIPKPEDFADVPF